MILYYLTVQRKACNINLHVLHANRFGSERESVHENTDLVPHCKSIQLSTRTKLDKTKYANKLQSTQKHDILHFYLTLLKNNTSIKYATRKFVNHTTTSKSKILQCSTATRLSETSRQAALIGLLVRLKSIKHFANVTVL